MKFFLIWFAVINGQNVPVDFEEPETFETMRECAAEVDVLAPQIDALLNRSIAAMANVVVIGVCAPMDDSKGN